MNAGINILTVEIYKCGHTYLRDMDFWIWEQLFRDEFFNFGAFNLKIEIFKDVGYFPKGIFPGVNFPNMQLPKSVLATALGPYCSLGHIGRPHPTFEKLPHGKFSLGKIPITRFGIWEHFYLRPAEGPGVASEKNLKKKYFEKKFEIFSL